MTGKVPDFDDDDWPIPPDADNESLDDIEAIQAGIEDLLAGRMWPLEEVDAEIRAKYRFPPDD
jgi:hypothetical protein